MIAIYTGYILRISKYDIIPVFSVVVVWMGVAKLLTVVLTVV